MRAKLNFFNDRANVNLSDRGLCAINGALFAVHDDALDELNWSGLSGRNRRVYNRALDDLYWINEAFVAFTSRKSRAARCSAVESCINCCSERTRTLFLRVYKESI